MTSPMPTAPIYPATSTERTITPPALVIPKTATTASTLDSNSLNAVTAGFDIGSSLNVAVQVVAVIGTHATHVITLQISNNNTNFVDTATTITGLLIADKFVTACRYLRGRVSTAEGGVSTVNLVVVAK